MQELFANKLALKVCDFTPLDIQKYYTELVGNLKERGSILASFVSPELALNDDGKYESVSRNADDMAKEVYGMFMDMLK